MTQPLLFVGSRLVLVSDGGGARLPTIDEIRDAFGEENVARARLPHGADANVTDGRTYGLPSDTTLPSGFRTEGLRTAYHVLPEDDFRAARRGRHMLHWVENHRFCSRCGAETKRDLDHLSMTCSTCGHLQFPRVAPAVIVLVQRDDQALLGRAHRFPPGVYSTLAGFVEPGESLEDCVHREIQEEAGVHVTNLRYFGSQPHPFPNSLMVGYVADWESGEVRVDPAELEDAQWFGREALPELPHPMSIASALIRDFVDRTR
ncbi:MAG: NAD(+) diphosphatase [Gemmatimonadota bacterium]